MSHQPSPNELLPTGASPEGLQSYDLTDPNGQKVTLQLPDADQLLPMADPQSVLGVETRMKRLYDTYGADMDVEFGLDIAASDLDDDEMMRFAAMRFQVQEPDRSFWGRVWDVTSFLPKKALGGAIDALGWAQNQTFNRLARALTHDQTATIGSLLVLGLGVLKGDQGAKDIFSQAEGRLSTQEWMDQQGWAGKTLGFLGDVFIDPLVMFAPVKALRTAGAGLKGTVGAAEAGVKLTGAAARAQKVAPGVFKARTTYEDVIRLARGQVKWQDVLLRNVPVADLVRKTSSTRDLFRAIALADDTANVARAFPLSMNVPPGTVRWLKDVADGAGDDIAAREEAVVNAVSNAFKQASEGTFQSPEFEKLLAGAGAAEKRVAEELGVLQKRIQKAYAKEDLTPTLFGDDVTEEIGLAIDAKNKELVELTKARNALLGPVYTTAYLDRLPRRALSDKAAKWLENSNFGKREGFWEAPGARQIAGAAGMAANKMRTWARMSPHRIIRVDDEMAHEQVRRLGNLFEESTGTIRAARQQRAGGTRGWTSVDTNRYVSAFLSASTDISKRDLLFEMEEVALKRMGLSQDQVTFLRSKYNETFNDFVSWVDESGKAVTKPILRSHLLNTLPVMDPFVFKRVGKLGAKIGDEDWIIKVNETMSHLNTAWKKLAVTRPAWAMRVVMLSELPRLAIAGYANPLTHPVMWLSASNVPGASAAARRLVERKIPESLRVPWDMPNERTINQIMVGSKELGSFRPAENPRNAGLPAFISWDQAKASGRKYERKTYVKGWSTVLNDWLRFDELARAMAAGDVKGYRDVLKWTKETSEGVRWMREVAQTTDPEELLLHAKETKKLFLDATKGGRKEYVDAIGRSDWKVLFDQVEAGLVEPPKNLPSSLWHDTVNRPGMSQGKGWIDRQLGGFFKFISSDITTAVARKAPYRWQVISELQRIASVDPSVDIRKVFNAVSGGNIESLSEVERITLRAATDNAARKVKQVVYDLAESGRAADMARFLAPFANAWQEEVTRWAMLTWARPHMPLLMMKAWQEKEDLPFSYTDPRTGQEIMYLPFGEQITKFATGKWNPISGSEPDMAWGLAVPWKNLNIITGNGFLPAGGPWLQIPAHFLKKYRFPILTEVARAIDPYDSNLMDKLIPSPFYREMQRQQAGEQDRTFASTLNTVIAELIWKNDGDFDKIDVGEAHRAARGLMALGGITNLLVGGGFRPRLAPGVQEIADYSLWLRGVAPEARERLLFERYGERIAGWMQAQSQAMSGMPPTREAQNLLLNQTTAPLASKYDKVFWSMFSERARGDFAPEVYANQVINGDRERIVGDDFYAAAMRIIAWKRYSELRGQRDAALARTGLTSQSEKAKPILDVYSDQLQGLFDTYDGFEKELTAQRSGEHRKWIGLLEQIVNEPEAQSLTATTGAKLYLMARQGVLNAMAQNGFKSLQSRESATLAAAWFATRESIFSQYPDFRLVHARLGLTNDDALGGQ